MRATQRPLRGHSVPGLQNCCVPSMTSSDHCLTGVGALASHTHWTGPSRLMSTADSMGMRTFSVVATSPALKGFKFRPR
jgi:hypothetical protein